MKCGIVHNLSAVMGLFAGPAMLLLGWRTPKPGVTGDGGLCCQMRWALAVLCCRSQAELLARKRVGRSY